MSSDMSKLLKRAVNEYTDEIAKEENKKIQIALDRTMRRIQEEVDEYLEWMSDAYYDGYEPILYERSMQLKRKETRPVNPYAEINVNGNMSNLSFGVVFNERSMDHSSYTVKARWYDKKNKQWKDVKKSKTYTVTPGKKGGKKPKEKTILRLFQQGIHPNASLEGITDMPTPMPLFTDAKRGAVPDMIEQWVESGALQDIFNNELKKLL